MNEDKQMQKQENAPNSMKGAGVESSSKWKKWTAKKWVFPAIYMAAAVIILSLMWIYQDFGRSVDSNQAAQNQESVQTINSGEPADLPDAVSATTAVETMAWPVENRDDVDVVMPFYDSGASQEDQQAAMIQYENSFRPNTGISLATKGENQAFNVTAALSGEVTRAESLPLIGNMVEITHDNGMKTIYQSLSDITVAKGAHVKQGDIIAKAGRNELEKSLGIHLHFEVLQDGQPVNPEQILTRS